jgi:hypothetical protein
MVYLEISRLSSASFGFVRILALDTSVCIHENISQFVHTSVDTPAGAVSAAAECYSQLSRVNQVAKIVLRVEPLFSLTPAEA